MANRASKRVSGLAKSFKSPLIKDSEGDICIIDEVNPGMKRLAGRPSYVQFGNTRYSTIPEENGKKMP